MLAQSLAEYGGLAQLGELLSIASNRMEVWLAGVDRQEFLVGVAVLGSIALLMRFLMRTR